jgi:Na+-driven multidrug efflux pump
MELDNLKQQMNRQLEDDNTWQPTEDFKEIIGKKSVNIVQKIRRSLWMETIMGILVNIPLAFLLGYRFPKLLQLSVVWLIFFLIIATIPVLIYLIAQTYWFEKQSSSIRENLTRIHQLITRYCQVNHFLTILAVPLGYTLGLYLTLDPNNQYGIGDIVDYFVGLSLKQKLFVVGVFVFFELLFYFLMRGYLNYFYSKYLIRIKEMIQELERE